MQILVLGASSHIGRALAQAFARGNRLILVGRNAEKLRQVQQACQGGGAAQTNCIEVDLAFELDTLYTAIAGTTIDLVIDASAAASRRRDGEIVPHELSNLVTADVLAKMKMVGWIIQRQKAPPAVILISTVLTLVMSPDRIVYTSLKRLTEAYYAALRRAHTDMRVLIVHVGTLVETERETPKAVKLAQAVLTAHRLGRQTLLYGLSGWLYLSLFYFQPLLFLIASKVQRALRKWTGRKLHAQR